ncbi:MAG TPA: NAD(P)-binding domain-containing protein [Nocardioides sp.]|nr:NAD(P)-binding domain-containing protein [Nocardioides sp.]
MPFTDLPTIGIVGVGEIAGAIVEGLCTDDEGAPDVVLSPRGAHLSETLARRFPTVRVCADNQEVAESASVLVLAVRPDAADAALSGMRVPRDALVVSVIAGVEHDDLHRLLGPEVAIVRAIPLPAVRRRAGVTAVHPAHPMATALFDRLGGTLDVADSHTFAALSAATGTISTHLGYLATIAAWTERAGVDGAEAERYVRSLFAGVAGGLADPSRSLAELATDHETPGGLNEQLRESWLDQANVAALEAGLDALLQRVTSAGSAGRPPGSGRRG